MVSGNKSLLLLVTVTGNYPISKCSYPEDNFETVVVIFVLWAVNGLSTVYWAVSNFI